MLLENQQVHGKAEEERIDEVLRETGPSKFWEWPARRTFLGA